LVDCLLRAKKRFVQFHLQETIKIDEV